jgi:uncharacterized membrane protein YkgB
VGAILAGLLAVTVFFVTKQFLFLTRERLSASALVASTVCLSTSGFLISETLGFLALGICLAVIAVGLGFESDGE